MNHRPIVSILAALSLLVAGVWLAGCPGDDDQNTSDGQVSGDMSPSDAPSSDVVGDDAPVGGLKWYKSCGDPVCRVNPGPSSAPPCTSETVGEPCSSVGATCDAGLGCGAVLVCAASDPRSGIGGCPISQRRFKTEIRYLSARDRERFHRELMQIRLATYRYKTAPTNAPKRLGFIIDDVSSRTCIDAKRERVDLYGYTSMAVAALQVQARKIAALERELALLKAQIGRLVSSPASECRLRRVSNP
ncbi:MAG: tail fiber domain-containing protein [Myxococcales bacterium]|nr:tail fiber domain-containing protein [Myxococcales bacterium]